MRKILIVDDDKDLALITSDTLESYGYEVKSLSGIEDTYEVLMKERFDLILLDINLPDGTGFEVCKELRKMSKVPVIFASARTSEDDKIKGLDLGGDDYLEKPYSLKEFDVLAYLCKNMDKVSDEMERIQYDDLIYWMNNNGKKIDKIVESMEAVDGVAKVVKENNAIIKIVIDGEEVGSSVLAYRYSESHASYHVFDGDTIEYKESPKVLEQGEVYVPICYKALHDIKIGDEIFFEGYEKAFTVKGFFEDPAGGNIMMGMKNVLISDADLKLFHEKQWKDRVCQVKCVNYFDFLWRSNFDRHI